MRAALAQAREARLFVLAKMREAIERPRPELSPYAPRFVTIKIRPEKIREIIGPGGKVVRGIQEQTGTKIDIEDDGRVTVFSPDAASVQRAIGMIQDITREVEVDRIYVGKVKKIVEFGAFVEVIPNTEGLLHISQIAESRIRSVQDVLSEGDEVAVKVIEVDSNGKMRLSRKMALREQPALSGREKLKNPNAANPPRD
jgi:polyribonucleotide nucleotidyltransferase